MNPSKDKTSFPTNITNFKVKQLNVYFLQYFLLLLSHYWISYKLKNVYFNIFVVYTFLSIKQYCS